MIPNLRIPGDLVSHPGNSNLVFRLATNMKNGDRVHANRGRRMCNDRPVITHPVIRGLRSSASPPPDYLTPQEPTNQDSSDMKRDGASLSCPGSSAVAEVAKIIQSCTR